WYLTSSLKRPVAKAEERALAMSGTLLERYGVVTRDIVLADKVPGGFSGLYRALSSLEDIGSVRRGYFVEGMGGAQFALPGAVERIRMAPDTTRIVLDSTDPANPYGSSLPWPDTDGKPERRAGATVLLEAGLPVAWLDKSGRRVVTFGAPPDETASAILILSEQRSRSTVAEIDRIDVRDHTLAPLLQASGFAPGYKGFTVRSTASTTRK
ncbi:MAG: Lhr family helicase, partial [Acidimicrobiia bacterium]